RSIIRKAGGFREYGSHGFALVSNFIDREREIANLGAGLGADFNEWLGEWLDLFAGQRTRDPRQPLSPGGIHLEDARMGIGRAHETEIQHFADFDVVGKLAAAAQQATFLFPR